MAWTISILLISFLLCLLRPYKLRRLGYAFVSLLRLLRSIRSLKWLHFALFFFCLLIFWPVSEIEAGTISDLNQDPTPTFVPIWSTPTPGPSLNYDCPEGLPGGYGYVTPEPLWMNYCAQCMPPESNYAWPTVEGFPTSTPLPIATVTPTPYPNNGLAYMYPLDNVWKLNDTGTPVNPFTTQGTYVWRPTGHPQGTLYLTDGNSNQNKTYQVTMKYSSMGTRSCTGCINYAEQINIWLQMWCNGTGTAKCQVEVYDYASQALLRFWVLNGGQASPYLIMGGPFPTNTGFAWNKSYIIEVTITGSQLTGADFHMAEGHTYTFVQGTTTEVRTISYLPGPFTPEIQSDSVCADINGNIPGEVPEDDIFGMPDISIGVSTCFTLGGWTIPLSWLQIIFPSASDWSVPGIQICFSPVQFGEFRLFGFGISLDLLAGVMAGVLLFRIITRS